MLDYKCIICGEPILRKIRKNAKWITCKSIVCKNEASRQKVKEYKDKNKTGEFKPGTRRKNNIDRLYSEVKTKEDFAKLYVRYSGVTRLAAHYKVLDVDIMHMRNTFFPDMNPQTVSKIGRELLYGGKIKEGTGTQKNKKLERIKIPVTCYIAKDIELLLQEIETRKFGDPVNYDNLTYTKTVFAEDLPEPYRDKELLEVEA